MTARRTRYRVVPHASSVTDSLGAGDALIGGVLSGLIAGRSPQDALTGGTQLAARTISHFGAFGYGFDVTSHPPASWDAGGVCA
jgi:sugar/nucleoside kinase (ribokinase family)